MRILRETSQPFPYVHIFPLLGLLKQICDHSAMVEGGVKNYSRHQSGKWDLFTELLSESLESGQKLLVNSQYLGVLEIMETYFAERKVGFVRLTGASRNRGNIVVRFNTDLACRMLLESLKAWGTGIDKEVPYRCDDPLH